MEEAAEIFLIKFEGAVSTSKNKSDRILYYKDKDGKEKILYYQEADKRRKYARKCYDKYNHK